MALRIDVADGAVTIEAENRKAVTGFASSELSGGHGLVGMRERAAMTGGRLDVHDEYDTFRIHAVLASEDTRSAR